MASAFWAITTYFNPSDVQTRLSNYRAFREHSRKQGLPLVAVEQVFGDRPFVLEEGRDAEIVVRKRASAVLWQKERLLNLALEALPRECRAVCWADADILFEDDDWIAQSSALLTDHVVIQPFSAAVRLPQGALVASYPGREVGRSIPKGSGEETYSSSVCAMMRRWLPRFSGSTGYVWCARRDFLDEVGFYDRCVVGGADREFAVAIMYPPGKVPSKHVNIHDPRLRTHLRPWHERVHAAVGGRYSYRPGVIHHLWHGASASRQYVDRHSILSAHHFDPDRDIALDDGGCWKWSTANTQLIDAVRNYFESRAEDG